MAINLIAVRLWQKVDYLVEVENADDAKYAMQDPLKRVGKLGEGDVHPDPIRVWTPTVEEIQSAQGVSKAKP